MGSDSREVDQVLAGVRRALSLLHLPPRPILLAVSGGGDSTAMFRALLEVLGRRQLRVAHLDHQLRGSESTADRQFVEELCRRWQVPLVVARVALSGIVQQTGQGLEATAREIRYQFLKRAALDLGCSAVATGHSADDQTETVLGRIFRGTGLAGLGGISPARRLAPDVWLIRPLLEFSRQQLVACLRDWSQPFCRDSTNDLPEATRTRLRLELLPQLRRDFNPRVDEGLRGLARQAREVQDWIRGQAEQLLEVAAILNPSGCSLAWPPLRKEPDFLLVELFMQIWDKCGWPSRKMSRQHWLRLVTILRAGGQGDLPEGIFAARRGERLQLSCRLIKSRLNNRGEV